MRVRISHLVNTMTRQALYERVTGYVSKEDDFEALEQRARSEFGIDRLHRFDLGENADGCGPKAREVMKSLASSESARILSSYPASAAALKTRLAELHEVPVEWVSLATGVAAFISNICHAFYEWGDRIVLPTPTFYVIEEYSLRSGALPIYLPASYEDGFAWTPHYTSQVVRQMQRTPVKMVWLCSPNNPTGQPVPVGEIERIVRAAEESFAMVVVDEAYGEYTDDHAELGSAARLLHRFENLIVLRSFSKAYGLAGMRVGYAMISSPTVRAAVGRQMDYFPVTGPSIELARAAVEDQDYLARTRTVTSARFRALAPEIAEISGCECIPTFSNIFLCRLRTVSTDELQERLLRQSILVARADVEGLAGEGWVRITVRDDPENQFLVHSLRCAALGSGEGRNPVRQKSIEC